MSNYLCSCGCVFKSKQAISSHITKKLKHHPDEQHQYLGVTQRPVTPINKRAALARGRRAEASKLLDQQDQPTQHPTESDRLLNYCPRCGLPIRQAERAMRVAEEIRRA